MSRYLVTGGTGFIGRWVTAQLLVAGHEVRIFDASPRPAMLDDVAPGLGALPECVTGDIADGSVRQAAEGCDGIVHLAGVMTVDAAADPVRAAQINLIGSLHVFGAAQALGLRRLAYVSTAGVFGPEDGTHPRPMTHYGAQKLAVEGAARAYCADHGLPSVGLRPYIVYGPGQSSGIAAGPSVALAAAVSGMEATIRFSGRVGFIYVEDVAAALVTAVTHDMSGASVCTLAGETAEMDHFVSRIRAAVPGAHVEIDGAPLRIPGDLAETPLPGPLAGLPVTGIDDGIARTLAHYRLRAAAGEPT
ncbi:NAD-dependent epimerase/dehydratase family protein [Mesobacterium pallidum]|uniref:NAD-dependent epimerase/dehydratase family protein n=1 Tax=Mesobacterium pallidum TaxID=2872037 RepID=UPI001EE2D782|nr:NAD(P)-dependent oxidoreductase [Mesobacterium pallidum]